MKPRTVKNPFIVGKYVSPEFFCDREEEVKQLIKHIENGRNVFFTAPRRLGKTGLIHHLFAQELMKEEYYCFFIDLYGTKSISELTYLLGKTVYDTLKSKGEKLTDKVVEYLKAIKFGVNFDSITGEPSLNVGLGYIEEASTTLDEIFKYLEKSDKPCVIAFDEFQQIVEYEEKNVEAILRTKIQCLTNTSFIYAGSKRHTISRMFASPSKPFYSSSIGMTLEPINKNKYIEFTQQKFEEYNKKIDRNVVEIIYDSFEGQTWYVHTMLNELFAMTDEGEVCTTEFIPLAEKNIIDAQQEVYLQLISQLGVKQKAILQAIARERNVTGITSASFIKKYNLSSASSVQSAVKSLLEKDIISKSSEGTYFIYDFFFRKWMAEY